MKIPFHAHLTTPYIWLAIILGALIVALIIWQMDFLKECMLGADGKGSGGKLMGLAYVLTTCFCEVFHVMKQQEFDTSHLLYFIGGALLFYGVIKASDVAALKFGQKQADAPKQDENKQP